MDGNCNSKWCESFERAAVPVASWEQDIECMMLEKIKEAATANKSSIMGDFACPHKSRPTMFSESMSQYFKLSSEQLLWRHERLRVFVFFFNFVLSNMENVDQVSSFLHTRGHRLAVCHTHGLHQNLVRSSSLWKGEAKRNWRVKNEAQKSNSSDYI